jgi:asparagine synthase (glutamine-hydrolysing)
MCGIAGFVSSAALDPSADRARLQRMVDALGHRGPDGQGILLDGSAALGHDRLAIIDLSPRGRQPMANEDGSIQIVFNGEIYNHAALREELVRAGHRFRSRSDTEALLHGYEAWGLEGLLERLEGMFAFAIWDAPRRRLALARDLFGIKPLYFARRDGRFVFASEMKAIAAYDGAPAQIDPDGLLASLHHFGVPAPLTVCAGVFQLEPASWLVVDLATGAESSRRYWRWTPRPEIEDPAAAEAELWETLLKSVERHLVSDVPVGLFLSGGIDSSLVAAACAETGMKPTCFTLALDDPARDESPIAALLCRHFGLAHEVEPMDEADARPFDARLGAMFDEPFAVSSALTTAAISARASRRFKVMLSGEGGDELFGGYSWYRRWIETYGLAGERRIRGAFARAFARLGGRLAPPADPLEGYADFVSAFRPEALRGLFSPEFLAGCTHADPAAAYREVDQPALAGFDRVQALDLEIFLPAVCLTKMDRTSMAFGLEVRVPFLDRKVAELSARIPPALRNPGFEPKGLLRRVARRHLPPALLEKKKQGFAAPVDRWFPRAVLLAEIDHALRGVDPASIGLNRDVRRGAARLGRRDLWRFTHTIRFLLAAHAVAPPAA